METNPDLGMPGRGSQPPPVVSREVTAQACEHCGARIGGHVLGCPATQDPIKAEFKRSCPRCGKSQVGTYATPNRDPQATVYWHADGTPDSCESSNGGSK